MRIRNHTKLGFAAAALLSAFTAARALAVIPEVIYGDDDRLDLFEPGVSSQLKEAARATGALLKKSDIGIDPADSTVCTLPGEKFGDALNLCPSEPFRDQPNPAFCSGFLVGEDLFVTAGHCIETQSDCESIAFVFGFNVDTAGKDATRVATSDVYGCKRLITRSLGAASQTDYAVVQLDRKVTDRTPLKFRRTGKIDDQQGIVVIGHPAGLPTKVAAGANVRTNAEDAFFVANLDTYGGNSGSAVLNAATYEVEGILVRGEEDFVQRNGCRVSNICTNDACRGEDVTRATEFAPFVTDPDEPQRPTRTLTVDEQNLDVAIPDDDQAGASVALEVSGENGKLASVSIRVKVAHDYVGDLELALVHPDGTRVVLQDQSGGNAQNLDVTFGDDGLIIPGLLALRGKDAVGTWKLVARDLAATDAGKITAVTLKAKVFAD